MYRESIVILRSCAHLTERRKQPINCRKKHLYTNKPELNISQGEEVRKTTIYPLRQTVYRNAPGK